ncbi:ABC transporter ATP-binding protein [Streptomyces xiamenensis]|uniref:ABC-type quaternary amine transporter n=1 Tax=Streptomyces xiamenensis TaxID=408015 RepID=A0A0F7G116_9ACTN|nr:MULTISPECIES: ABC transporter ATP-binding protein [Streptomyces]AKG46372.1 ABC transporter [Streptomyces xiamenensis]
MTTAAEFLAVSRRFGDFTAVDALDLAIREGELTTLLGPSGCGKTTSLRMLAGYLSPTEGSIFIGGKDVTNTPPEKRDLGMVFQSYALFPHMSVADNVGYGLKLRKVPRAERAKRVAEALELVGLGHLADRRPKALSGGQQQRVALARAIVIRPRLLLLDEPLSNLDARLRVQMREEIRRIQGEAGLTVVLVTHDQEEALEMSDRMVVMNGGRVMQEGPPDDLFPAPANRFVAEFLGYENFFELPGRGLVTVRPELLRVHGPSRNGNTESGEGTAVSATVTSIAYRGVELRVSLDAVDATGATVPLIASVRRDTVASEDLPALLPGGRVTVSAAPGHLVALES